VKIGDLVSLNWGSAPELESVKPTEWFARSVTQTTPLIFLHWVKPHGEAQEDGWASLLHPDGSKKIVHCDYFIRLTR